MSTDGDSGTGRDLSTDGDSGTGRDLSTDGDLGTGRDLSTDGDLGTGRDLSSGRDLSTGRRLLAGLPLRALGTAAHQWLRGSLRRPSPGRGRRRPRGDGSRRPASYGASRRCVFRAGVFPRPAGNQGLPRRGVFGRSVRACSAAAPFPIALATGLAVSRPVSGPENPQEARATFDKIVPVSKSEVDERRHTRGP